MAKSTKNLIRLISIIIILVVVMMKFGVITSLFTNNGEFWMVIVAYGMVIFTLRK